MAWGDDYLCFAIYFEALPHKTWERAAWEVLHSLARCAGCEPTHMDFRTPDRQGPSKGRPWRCITRNTNRLMNTIDDSGLSTMDLFHVGADVDFVMSPFSAAVDNPMSSYEPQTAVIETGNLSGQIMVDRVEDPLGHSRQCATVLDVVTRRFSVFYGFFHVYYGGKYPGIYFRQGTSSQHLSRAEIQNCKEWGTIGQKRQNLIRGVYWGNLLTQTHWGGSPERRQRLATRLATECGASVCDVSDMLFFSAPFSLIRRPAERTHKFDPPRDESWERQMVEFRKSCRRVLAEEGVLMLDSPEE